MVIELNGFLLSDERPPVTLREQTSFKVINASRSVHIAWIRSMLVESQ